MNIVITNFTMTSFNKISESLSTIPGTKLKNNLSIISSGIPSMDHLFGGGLPCSGIFLLEEDTMGNYSRVLSKYYLAEGIVSKHALLIASADEDPMDIVIELPSPCVTPPKDDVSSASESVDKMKIAWRYEGLGQVESSFGSNSNFGHHFDLSKHIDSETIESSSIAYWSPSSVLPSNKMYNNLLANLRDHLAKEEYQCTSKTKNILRIFIQSLGSPVWLAEEGSKGYADLLRFLYCLRVLLRDTNAAAFISMPSHLFEEEGLINRILYCVDNAARLESFVGSTKETNPVFKDYHGLFHITRITAMYTLVPHVPPAQDLAFKLRRKKFVIEKLHLPPELQESSEREQDDITAVPLACGGFKKKDIEF